MDTARAYRLLTRAGPPGYDPSSRTFRPWHRLLRYSVKFQSGRGLAKLRGVKIELSNPANQCPHVILHDFVHEAGHAQFLLRDLAVLAFVLPDLRGAAWYWFIVAILTWQFVWRELMADLYSVRILGFRNTWRGYAHMDRKAQMAKRRSRGLKSREDQPS